MPVGDELSDEAPLSENASDKAQAGKEETNQELTGFIKPFPQDITVPETSPPPANSRPLAVPVKNCDKNNKDGKKCKCYRYKHRRVCK